MIPFQRISRKLENEGLTVALLHWIQSVVLPGNFVMIKPGDEPVAVLKANDKAYWLVGDNGAYLREPDGTLVTVPAKDVVIGKARYFITHFDAIVEAATQAEAKAQHKHNQAVAMQFVRQFEAVCEPAKYNFDSYAFTKEDERRAIRMVIFWSGSSDEQSRIEQAIFDLAPQYQCLRDILQRDDRDMLHVAIHGPEIGRWNNHADTDLNVLLTLFHAHRIEDTLLQAETKGHLHLVAKARVLKRFSKYAPKPAAETAATAG